MPDQHKTENAFEKFTQIFQRVKPAEVNMFTRLLFVLQKAGLPILSSLQAIGEQLSDRILKAALEKIGRDIEAGTELSTALGKHPGIFNPLYVSMIKAGEVSGTLPEILTRLATLGERDEAVRARIKAAMRYPFIVVGALVVGFLVLIVAVVPRFESLYSNFSTDLPLPTQILLGINAVITQFWWLLIIAGVGGFFLFRHFVKMPKGMVLWDGFKLKIPVFGLLTLKIIMSRFCRLTGTLMRSGVPILKILELVSDNSGNVIISNTIDKVSASVNEGKGMSGPMKSSGLFPPIVIQMVSAGEKTGKMDELLIHVSDYYDSDIDYTINDLVSLVEPMLIFVMGGAVLLLALGIFLPMWNMIEIFR